MRNSSRAALTIVSLTLVSACSEGRRSPFDPAAESAKLSQRDAEWADLATAGKDVDKIVSYWTDDAVLMEPGQPAVEGKDAIRAFVTASLKAPVFKIHWISQKPVFSADGKMAYMRGTDEMTVPGANGAPVALHLQGYSIWRIDTGGQWRCVVDIATEAPSPAGGGAKS
jgi:ketosteroid isomerase-like protein